MTGLLALLLAAAPAVGVSAEVRGGEVVVVLDVPAGLHVNANPASADWLIPVSVRVEAAPTGVTVGAFAYPPGVLRAAGGSAEPISVYEGRLEIRAPLRVAPGSGGVIRGVVTYQACDERSCFAPAEAAFEVDLPPAPSPGGSPTLGASTAPPPAAEPPPPAAPPALAGGGLGAILAAFLAGLALNLTPCVYPIVPVTVGYFARQAGGRGRTLLLAALYATSLAVVYAALGTTAALTGALFGRLLQSPWVVGGLAALSVGMALGMFGLFETAPAALLPTPLGRLLDRLSQARPGPAGAAAMGATMGLVAAPCIGPFIVALLAYVGARGDPAEGFRLFLALGLGLGTPYVPLAFVASRLAAWPRAGPALVAVKRLLGVALLALAVWFSSPLLPAALEPLLYAAVLVAGGAGTALAGVEGESGGARLFRRAAGLALVAAGLLLPVRAPAPNEPTFVPYTEKARVEAWAANRPIVIDFSADWCLPCRELDRFTFSDPDVRARLERVAAFRADVTGPEIDPEVRRAVEEFGVEGVPTVVFLAPGGGERRDLRLEGFEGPGAFRARLDSLRSP